MKEKHLFCPNFISSHTTLLVAGHCLTQNTNATKLTLSSQIVGDDGDEDEPNPVGPIKKDTQQIGYKNLYVFNYNL